jgi:hypothetical protein
MLTGMPIIVRTLASIGLLAVGAWFGRNRERSRSVREELRQARAEGTGPVRVAEDPPQDP